jgi:hypothetical protein
VVSETHVNIAFDETLEVYLIAITSMKELNITVEMSNWGNATFQSEALNITVEMSNWGNAKFQTEGSVV